MSIALIWFIIGTLFIMAELLLPAFVLLFFGIGAWAASLAIYLGASLPISLAVFSLISVATLLVLRRFLIKTFKGTTIAANEKGTIGMHVGKNAVVTQTITMSNVGEVSIGGSYWRAVLDTKTSESNTPEYSIEIGKLVLVSGHDADDAILLQVRPT